MNLWGAGSSGEGMKAYVANNPVTIISESVADAKFGLCERITRGIHVLHV